ncbi:MAG: glycosyltransferase family 2 protein [Carboxylicivirga sp.]|jgi:glycosyltransferase involved in cell wall biosynthesis|nr:glycosyltransferase family 2 protein [Carboxylicivirga sp.]
MLSICIPVYNVDVRELIEDLLIQSENTELDIEIHVVDDGSDIEFKRLNRSIRNNPLVKYQEHSINKGCARIRNQMAEISRYNHILFIDSDSKVNSEYLKRYKILLGKHLIVCGGRVHPDILPSPNKTLRWTVGHLREDFSAQERMIVPNKSFMSNNFMIQKQLLNDFRFDEEIKRSGHEDTMMGIQLENQGISIYHIDNPVTHIGLEDNADFIIKTRQRIETLHYLLNARKDYLELMKKRIKLLRYFVITKSFGLVHLSNYLFKINKSRIEKNLSSNKPSMVLYDFYKLGYFSNVYLNSLK